MTAERQANQDDDETGVVLALTLPLVAHSVSPESGPLPAEFATHLSTFDREAASFAEASAVVPGPTSGTRSSR